MWFRKEPEPPEPSLAEQLVDAEAEVARLKALPVSAFTPRVAGGFITTHSVDRKTDAVDYAKATVAELKIRVKGNKGL